MSAKHYKYFFFLAMAAIIIAFFVFWLANGKADNLLEVNFFDAGQGDVIFIKAPRGQNILIDGGPDNSVLKQLEKNLDFWDKKIDLLVLTHPHSDHIGGLIEVMKRYSVGKILYTGVVHTSPDYIAWLDLIKEKKIPLLIIDRPQTIKLGEECAIKIIFPRESLAGKEVDSLNNSSIAAVLTYGQSAFFFAGDIEADIEQRLIASKADLSADVIKIGHHGSNTSTGEEFLKAVNPKIAVIQVGKDNGFGHPSGRVLKRLERAGVKVYRTDIDGAVKIKSDGNYISVE